MNAIHRAYFVASLRQWEATSKPHVTVNEMIPMMIKKQCGDPLWGKPRWDACPVSSMDCLTLSHKAHSECSRGLPGVDPVRVGDAGDGEDIGGQKETS